MDNALGPRDIQARIRSGRSVDEVAEIAGLPLDKVERFAAPVLAEREYVAQQASGAPVRRRGETSGHRRLRVAIAERLAPHRIDVDDVSWDSARMEDGRWAVTASIRVEERERLAVFHYDLAGRFSVAGNDDARWLLGESRPGGEADDEPTIDLNDDLAIVRSVVAPAVQEATGSDEPGSNVVSLRGERAHTGQPAPAEPAEDEATGDVPAEDKVTGDEPARDAGPVVDEPADDDAVTDDPDRTDEGGARGRAEDVAAKADAPADQGPAAPGAGGLDILYDILDRAGTEFTEDSVEILRRDPSAADESKTLQTAAETVETEADGAAAPDPADSDVEREDPAPGATEDGEESTSPVASDDRADHVSDAAAVPKSASTDASGAEFERQAPASEYPVEPSLFDDDPELAAELSAPQQAQTPQQVVPESADVDPAASGAPAAESPSPDQPAPEEPALEQPALGGEGQAPAAPAARTEHVTGAPAAAPGSQTAKPDSPSTPSPGASGLESVPAETTPSPEEAPAAQPPASAKPEPQPSPGQPAAAALEDKPASESKPAPKKRSRKRASVPSWDEIMFGSPRSKR